MNSFLFHYNIVVFFHCKLQPQVQSYVQIYAAQNKQNKKKVIIPCAMEELK
jgi:hypothetical protein